MTKPFLLCQQRLFLRPCINAFINSDTTEPIPSSNQWIWAFYITKSLCGWKDFRSLSQCYCMILMDYVYSQSLSHCNIYIKFSPFNPLIASTKRKVPKWKDSFPSPKQLAHQKYLIQSLSFNGLANCWLVSKIRVFDPSLILKC